jgi:hypothetical protein
VKKLVALLLVVTLAVAMIPAAVMAQASLPFMTDLIADGGGEETAMDVGDVEAWNDGDNLYVKYVIADTDWCLIETHLHVATDPDDIPQKNGNPPTGTFDYSMEHDWLMEYTYTIHLGDWAPNTDLFIAAHAEIQTEETVDGVVTYVDETAWGAGEDFPGRNWATYFVYRVQGP